MATFPLSTTDRKGNPVTFETEEAFLEVSSDLDAVILGKVMSQLGAPPDDTVVWFSLCIEHFNKSRLKSKISRAAVPLIQHLAAEGQREDAKALYVTVIDPLAPERFDAWWSKNATSEEAGDAPDADVSPDAAEIIEDALDADSYASEEEDDAVDSPLAEEPEPEESEEEARHRRKAVRRTIPRPPKRDPKFTRRPKAHDTGPTSAEWPLVRVLKESKSGAIMVTVREGYFQTFTDANGVVQVSEDVLDAERTCPSCGETHAYSAFGHRWMRTGKRSEAQFVRRPQPWCPKCRKASSRKSEIAKRTAHEEKMASKKAAAEAKAAAEKGEE